MVEVLVVFAPLFVGPFLFAYGLVQVMVASFQNTDSTLPAMRVHTKDRAEEPETSWRRRGKRNLARGAALSVGLVLVALALVEAAT